MSLASIVTRLPEVQAQVCVCFSAIAFPGPYMAGTECLVPGECRGGEASTHLLGVGETVMVLYRELFT